MDNPKKLSIAKMLIMNDSICDFSIGFRLNQAQQPQPDSDGKVVTNATVKGTVLDEVGPVIGASVMARCIDEQRAICYLFRASFWTSRMCLA